MHAVVKQTRGYRAVIGGMRRTMQASWLAVVFYPGRLDHGVARDEQRLLTWSELSVGGAGDIAVLAVSAHPDAGRRPLASALSAVSDESNLWVVCDPRGLIGSALGVPVVQTQAGSAYEHSTLLMRGGRPVQLWHPVDPRRDAEIVSGWIASQSPIDHVVAGWERASQFSEARGSES
jgi:hypothetical protein